MSLSKYKKQVWIILGLTALVFFSVGGGIAAFFIHYSGTSEQVCRQCHPELSEMWNKSNGHPSNETSCYECHSQSLKILPKGWNFIKHTRDQLVPPEYLADDELTSKRCLECHQDILNLGYIIKKKIIKFNHRYHYTEGLDCVNCHRTAGHEYMANNTNRPSVLECIECHLKEFEGPAKNRRCLNCHDVMLAPGKTLNEKSK